jgi:hypothetical protein
MIVRNAPTFLFENREPGADAIIQRSKRDWRTWQSVYEEGQPGLAKCLYPNSPEFGSSAIAKTQILANSATNSAVVKCFE